ncbi:hypothetical protein DTO271D3_7207 [Paecilomyces variotii]|nr:hypothetical protein DTO169E5_2481 [Paecilomyces variotii]KAJ9257948.1 hypothetical protein DTO207G8_1725 [Paecilomyces variotii]KAJ9312505.1 hypothetical protein DTO271D3_7207 [Paecilomyces variotii]
MIEDEIYRSSTQFRLWSFTQDSLASLRSSTNALAGDRVRAALRRARQARQSATEGPSVAGTPTPGDAEAKTEGGPEKEIECLTPQEELELVGYYCEKTLELGETYKPPLPTIVRATAIQYLRRFYLTNSPMTYHPKSIMACALFLATKTENYYMSLRSFADGIPGKNTAEDVIAPEFLLTQGLRFTFDVRHPFRGLEGGIMELEAIAQGEGRPAPHQPTQTADGLKRALHSIPPPPDLPADKKPPPLADRIRRAHHNTREILKTAAQMTDAYFLYTPSQIWLSAFLLADRPLAEFYLNTKLGLVAGGTAAEPTDPIAIIRQKLSVRLADCSTLLGSYKPLSSDPDKMKSLKRIGKKLYQCQNPEKIDLVGLNRAKKRNSGNSSTGVTPSAAGSGAVSEGVSESEMERAAKKRRLEREKREKEARDLFGGDIVMQRVKQQNAEGSRESTEG